MMYMAVRIELNPNKKTYTPYVCCGLLFVYAMRCMARNRFVDVLASCVRITTRGQCEERCPVVKTIVAVINADEYFWRPYDYVCHSIFCHHFTEKHWIWCVGLLEEEWTRCPGIIVLVAASVNHATHDMVCTDECISGCKKFFFGFLWLELCSRKSMVGDVSDIPRKTNF